MKTGDYWIRSAVRIRHWIDRRSHRPACPDRTIYPYLWMKAGCGKLVGSRNVGKLTKSLIFHFLSVGIHNKKQERICAAAFGLRDKV